MPSRVTGQPKLIYNGYGKGRTLLIPCDDGIYTLDQIANHIGITKMSVLGRAKRRGWIGTTIFSPARPQMKGEGNEEWQSLSDRVRGGQKQIKNPAPFDCIKSNGCDNVMGV